MSCNRPEHNTCIYLNQVHPTASEALSAAQDAQIEKKAEKKRKAKEKTELQEPAPTKMKISPTNSGSTAESVSNPANDPNSSLHPRPHSNLSKIPTSMHPLLLQAVDAHLNLTGSSSLGPLNLLPSPIQHPTESFGK